MVVRGALTFSNTFLYLLVDPRQFHTYTYHTKHFNAQAALTSNLQVLATSGTRTD